MSGYAKYFPLLRARFCLYGAHAAKWYEKREAAQQRKDKLSKKEVVESAYLGQYIWIYSTEPPKRNQK